ncbi:putative ABC-type Cd(2+) transporter [Helianthus annuus]|uniref:ABC-type Cd(2+) transporter n=1 Tax=Helianthus annuus TaxID=4232 RepID=A0A251UMD9_HELAN|nr:probable serine/threonine-protein kinase abkC [Helianthus annuus]KAF5804240.1 putative ABC-type Cd(2+) transporter [Helianthus annuus]KAJ0568896.1 putative ABC-type Cd(2+) transporter [Helianthus annuus]
MSRLLTVRNVKRIVRSIRTNNSRIQLEDRKHGSVDRITLYSSLRSYSIIPNNDRTTRYAQNAWKTISQNSSHTVKSFPSISRISQAFSLAATRSYIIIPGIYAFACGNTAFAQARHNAEYFQPRNTLYTHAENGHAFLISSAVSVYEGLILIIRAIYLSILFSPCIASAPFAGYFGNSSRKSWLRLIRRTLEIAGPAFIKWGQWAATRPDLFPRDLCTELSKLHSQAPEHSFSYTRKTVEKAFGRKIHEIFDDFEEVPVASGSIAQIHRAVLRYKYRGKQIKPLVVAVKVRHPGVGESIRRDFEIINVVAKISRFIPTLKWLRLDESVQQFAVFMMSQVDLAREAANLSRFAYNFRRWRDVSFPKPVYPLVHPAVLVETFEQGESVAYYVDELKGHERLKSSLAHIGTHALLKMLLVDNFIHADMHPGNILVRNKSSRKRIFKSKPHLIFLDVGMTAELSYSDRINLLEFFKAVARRDGATAAKCTLRLSKQQNCPNPQAFIKEVKESFDFWGTPEGDIVHPADAMHQLLEQVRRHRVNVDGNVSTVMVTTLVLEGWQRKLDPDYDIMNTLQTLLLKEDWAKSLTYTIERLMAP